jgi:hypothetical protein
VAPCGDGEEWVCGARDGVPADVLEPYLSSYPSGQTFLRLSKPLMTMAYAVETRGVFFPLLCCNGVWSGGSRRKRGRGWRRSTVEDWPQMVFFVFSLFAGVVCAKVLGQLW